MWAPLFLTHLAQANAELGQFKTAGSNIHEAMTAAEVTKERWYEAETNRVAGEIALLGTEADAVKAEAYFASALKIAWKQESEILGTPSGNEHGATAVPSRQAGAARDILAPVYGWFTEGLDALDLRQAELLLEELAQDQPINATEGLRVGCVRLEYGRAPVGAVRPPAM